MTGMDVALLVLLALAAAVFWSATIWGWGTDRREWSAAPGTRGRELRMPPELVGRHQLAITLFVTDAFIWYVTLKISELPWAAGAAARVADRISTGAFIALLPLLLLWYTTRRFGRPAFLVQPWARAHDRSSNAGSEEHLMQPKSGLLTFAVGVAVFVFGLSVIWLFGVHQAIRFWGLLPALLSVGVFTWAVRANRRRVS
jgi:hypothetical protein